MIEKVTSLRVSAVVMVDGLSGEKDSILPRVALLQRRGSMMEGGCIDPLRGLSQLTLSGAISVSGKTQDKPGSVPREIIFERVREVFGNDFGDKIEDQHLACLYDVSTARADYPRGERLMRTKTFHYAILVPARFLVYSPVICHLTPILSQQIGTIRILEKLQSHERKSALNQLWPLVLSQADFEALESSFRCLKNVPERIN